MIRHCCYSNKTSSIKLYGWNEDGDRSLQTIPYKPYIMVEHKDGEYDSLYDTKLKKIEFNDEKHKRRFVNDSPTKRIFENLPATQQYLIDNYWEVSENTDLMDNPLYNAFFDIETTSGEGGKGFPNVDLADHEIVLVTIYNSLTKQYHTFGTRPYNGDNIDIIYTPSKSEKDMFINIVEFIESDHPDNIIGWNSVAFDIPYLCNRIERVLNKQWVSRLSPERMVFDKTVMNKLYGTEYQSKNIIGMNNIDYLDVYKKFNMTKQPNYKLDTIGEEELGVGKIEYSGKMNDLIYTDWDKFVDYNIRDVEILVNLEKKLKYMDLLRFISLLGFCSMEKGMETLGVVNGAVACRARMEGKYIPTFVKSRTGRKIAGGYVADPITGLAEDIISFDANSLYPSVMITCNMSPETKLGMVKVQKNGTMRLQLESGEFFNLPKDKFVKYLKSVKGSLAANGVIFSQEKMGAMPKFLDWLYTNRKVMKSRMFELKGILVKGGHDDIEKRLLEDEIQLCNTYQHAYKIVLNSTYGYCANEYAAMGDLDIGEAVTLTGQATIKKSNTAFKEYMSKTYQELTDKEIEDSIRYNDTDSVYVTLTCLREKYGIHIFDEENNISKEFYDVCDGVEKYINDSMESWARKSLQSIDPRLVFKREAVADRGIFLAPKKYILHIRNDEGVDVDKFKYIGVEVVTTKTPKSLKPMIKSIIESVIMDMDKKKATDLYIKSYDMFKTLPSGQACNNGSMNTYNKWIPKGYTGFKAPTKTPQNVKAAYFFNEICRVEGLEFEYEKLVEGDKIKFAYVQTPNKYGITVIGFGTDNLPAEVEENVQVDYNIMFDRIVSAPIKRIYESVGWVLRPPNRTLKIDLCDFLSE
jgi:DNA polymerase elongation subunit (family B)